MPARIHHTILHADQPTGLPLARSALTGAINREVPNIQRRELRTKIFGKYSIPAVSGTAHFACRDVATPKMEKIMIKLGRVSKQTRGGCEIPGWIEDLVNRQPGCIYPDV